MSKLYDYFKKLKSENKIVQSYLIGNVKYDKIEKELNDILNSFFFDDKSNSNLDTIVLKSEEGIISKDDIKMLIDNISKTSQFNNKKVYIIDECEKLNSFAYNAILKTLEEPPEGIYAFLITKNMDAVKETIASRCQKIFISNEIEYEIDDENIALAKEIIDHIEKNNIKFIYKNYDYYNVIEDKKHLSLILMAMLNIYEKNLNKIVYDNKKDDNEKIELLGKKILIINDIIALAENNLNKNLCLDRLIVEMWRCNNNENSWN